MGSFFSSTTADDFIAPSLVSSQLVHRQTLSTCYDPIFDVSKDNSILVSDDGRLRLFHIDLEKNEPLSEVNPSSTKVLAHDQVQDIAWSDELNRFLILTNKRLATFDQENNLVNLDLQLEKGSAPLWRMACWSSYLLVNLGVGASIRSYRLTSSSSSLMFLHSWSRVSLDYQPSDSLSSLALSPQLILAINVELAEHRHVIDLFSFNKTNLTRLQRLDTRRTCPLDVITSLRNYTWLCKSHWPQDDCLCLIESDGEVKKIALEEQTGYILNARLVTDRSHLVVVRTSAKLPNETEQIPSTNESHRRRERQALGKLPPNLLLEIYRVPSALNLK